MEPRYYHQVVGINSRLDSMQAAVLNVKLPHLDRWAERRQRMPQRYTELFRRDAGWTACSTLPATAPELHACLEPVHDPRARWPPRRAAAVSCAGKVGTEIYYPVPLHQQACFRIALLCGRQPAGYRSGRRARSLSLPIFPELAPAEIETVVYRIAEFFGVRRPQVDPTIRRPHFLDQPVKSASALPKVA